MTIIDKPNTTGSQSGRPSQEHRAGVGIMAEQMMQETAGKAILAGYKQTEVGVIPEHWAVFSLGDIFSFKNGLNKAKSFFGFGYPIVNYMDVYSSCSIDGRRISGRVSVGDSERKNYSAIKNDVFFTRTSETVDEIGLASVLVESVDNTVFSGFLLRARQRSDFFVGNYMKYCLREKSIRNQIQGTASYTTRALTNGSLLSKILIPVPTKQEQIAIANVMSDSDALIDALEQLIAKKQAIKSATMQQLLTGRTRLPAFALRPDGTPKGYKPSELGEIPEDWEAKKMGGVAQIQRGASPRPIDSPVWFDRNSSVGWLRISDVTKTVKYLFDTTQSLSEMGVAHSRFVSSNNLVMSICATVGKPIITKKDLCIHDGFVVFHGLTVNQDYMYYVLKDLEDEWGKQGQTGSQMNLNTDLINGTLIALPREIEEQTAIATVLSDMDNELQALTQKLEKARALKQGMMQQLLTGKIRLPLTAGA
ncbi:restriction endonuclease subunit S [Aeromonas veronii]